MRKLYTTSNSMYWSLDYVLSIVLYTSDFKVLLIVFFKVHILCFPLFFAVLWMEPRALHIPDRPYTTH